MWFLSWGFPLTPLKGGSFFVKEIMSRSFKTRQLMSKPYNSFNFKSFRDNFLTILRNDKQIEIFSTILRTEIQFCPQFNQQIVFVFNNKKIS